jgi:hypothetical protein
MATALHPKASRHSPTTVAVIHPGQLGKASWPLIITWDDETDAMMRGRPLNLIQI